MVKNHPMKNWGIIIESQKIKGLRRRGKLKVGIGYDNQKNSISLGKKVAENAMKNGKIENWK